MIKSKEIILNIIVSKSLIFQNILEIKFILFFLKFVKVSNVYQYFKKVFLKFCFSVNVYQTRVVRFIYSYLEKPEEGDVELGGWTADLSKLTFDLAAAWVASRALKQTNKEMHVWIHTDPPAGTQV